MSPHRDTVFARSSGAGRAGIAVYRISGPKAGPVLDQFCGGRGEPRRAHLVRMRLDDGTVLDEGIALWFPAPRSFTGEDVCELHLHGSPAVERAFGDAMVAFGLIPATAGEFTLRAFEAGKLDLAQAEGLSDLLSAETDAQRRQALGQLGGRLSERAAGWRSNILSALASIEAAVDFPEEEDIPGGIADRAMAPLRTLSADMRNALDGARGASRLRTGTTVAIVGPPNVGKSSILNQLAGTDRAIVADEEGTTRDLLETSLEIGGQLVTLIDTAGLREAAGNVELEGIRRARHAAETADLLIEVRDARTVTDPAPLQKNILFVANKMDLYANATSPPYGWLALSTVNGRGTDRLLQWLSEAVETAGEGALTRDRHVGLVRRCVDVIDNVVASSLPPELLAEELRVTLLFLDELVGRVAPDEILGEIFSAFCIGK